MNKKNKLICKLSFVHQKDYIKLFIVNFHMGIALVECVPEFEDLELVEPAKVGGQVLEEHVVEVELAQAHQLRAS